MHQLRWVSRIVVTWLSLGAWMTVVEVVRSFSSVKIPDPVVWLNLLLGYLLSAVGCEEPLVNSGSHLPFPSLWVLSMLVLAPGLILIIRRWRRPQ